MGAAPPPGMETGAVAEVVKRTENGLVVRRGLLEATTRRGEREGLRLARPRA